ncbi:MAG: type II toxin-antitoxin system RelE/ParE family toxin [Symploca sp. SIO1C4]|uniref:Type II toxin-antitoxin system RelE/ParE family toxin n=1 Tax=Symploca sp. SIO1C4 TaxID=2607765 RepID=A0A6B3N7J8_9CYAN|nr:type II toxin-antitoxin system RelE/ParE family toxin [Symploca sp. SIO1C4]
MSEIFKRPLAERDLDEIWDYLEEYSNQQQAAEFVRKLYAKMESLARNPYMGRLRDELLPQLRSFPFQEYLIFYFPLNNGIEVVRVLYGRRDLEPIFQQEGEQDFE